MFQCFEIFLVRNHWDAIILCMSVYAFPNYVSSLSRCFLMIAFSATGEVCCFLPFKMYLQNSFDSQSMVTALRKLGVHFQNHIISICRFIWDWMLHIICCLVWVVHTIERLSSFYQVPFPKLVANIVYDGVDSF